MADMRYRQILEDMEEGYYEIDLNGTFTFVNKIVCDIAEAAREELIGMNYGDYTSKATARRVFKTFNKVFETGFPQRIEYEIILKSTKRKILENSVSLLRDNENNIKGFCGLVSDITRRKRLQEQLRENRERFEALFENANELIITTDAYGYIRRMNKKVEEISGYSRSFLIGKSILVIAHPDDRPLYIDFWKQLLEGNTPRLELRAVAKDGSVVWLLASGSAISKGGTIIEVQYNAQEISSLKKAQQTIVDLKNHLSSIFESSPNMIVCMDRDGKVLMANPVTERIFHKPAAVIVGRDLSSLSPPMASYRKIIQHVQREGVPQFIHEAILSDLNDHVFDVHIYPLMDATLGGVVFTAVDISEKKHMELQLIHAQKMETIGELAGGVAHDFNNILTGITGNISMLRYTTDEDKRERYLSTLESITERARDLTRQMLAFTKRNEGKPESISIREAIGEVIDISVKSIPKKIKINYNTSGKDYRVFIDHTHLIQVLLNLIVNAKDAIGDKLDGLISVSVNPFVIDKDTRRQYLLGSIGRYVRIDVSDNGAGMRMDILPKIFDPFYSTKQKGPDKGTGLGLSIAYNIVKNAGGSIQVSSVEGKGSIFSVFLPLSKSKAKARDAIGRITRSTARNRARILIVDDEAMLRDIGKEMLCLLGHTVETASNGHECIEILKNNQKGFDLIILDMIMPEMDGYHTLLEMQKLGIDARVVISSGFSFEHEKDDFLSNPLIVARLNKPFNLNELSQIIDESLL
ncbi:MAG: PAS domain S-box protein [Desulfobacterota bacterium]|nr:PAS domain S-box protein [Thermodesulfobacteriota bacterium]